ncbi:hypothetical protein [Mycobacteroides saopaulense]|uniref:DUF3558 domain-containing protein n=1 Tax=Mycobacteroides saopaulense TaxID=1578165 RepID=A0ABX3BUB8_9MYCO|nr:hypothetical protein [Mycobacteroides saopaulense]OHT87671.1 hypothetical protein BKG68_06485 [Mycobacteroides saopaulense]OHU06015.1 hypothetical protein BKG73_20630 [Mycobacteroides saopaulense]
MTKTLVNIDRAILVALPVIGVLLLTACTSKSDAPEIQNQGTTISQTVVHETSPGSDEPLTRVQGDRTLRLPHENYGGEIAGGSWTGTPNNRGSCEYIIYLPTGESFKSGRSQWPDLVHLDFTTPGGTVQFKGDCVWTQDPDR